MKYCTNCGQKLNENSIFCAGCGTKIGVSEIIKEPSKIIETTSKASEISTIKTDEIDRINKKITIQNSQSSIVKKSFVIAIIGFIIAILPFMESNPLTGIWALALVGFFTFLSASIVALIFRSREKKLQSLISGENILASWTLTADQKFQYVELLYNNEKSKNKGVFIITAILIVVIFGGFILFIEEGKMAMFLIMCLLIAVVGFFAFTLPSFYKSKNLQNDGHILIGKKFAYINGFFHNWDFPLSGIRKASIIKEPFYGLHFQYYYTDRTFTNTEELNIPAPENFNLQDVLNSLKNHN